MLQMKHDGPSGRAEWSEVWLPALCWLRKKLRKEIENFLFYFHSFIISSLQKRFPSLFPLLPAQHTWLTRWVGRKEMNSTACRRVVKQVVKLQQQVQSVHIHAPISKTQPGDRIRLGSILGYGLMATHEPAVVRQYHLTVHRVGDRCPNFHLIQAVVHPSVHSNRTIKMSHHSPEVIAAKVQEKGGDWWSCLPVLPLYLIAKKRLTQLIFHWLIIFVSLPVINWSPIALKSCSNEVQWHIPRTVLKKTNLDGTQT